MTDATTPLETFEGARFRQVLGHFPTGVTIVTATVDGEPLGMAVGSFTSVSLDPPLVAFLPDRKSSTFEQMRHAKAFCVNVLASDQEAICRTFARRGSDRFESVAWRPASSGSPILEGVVAWIDCDIESITPAGDHYLAMGRVRGLDIHRQTLPLVFFRGGYGAFSSQSLVVAEEPGMARVIRFSNLARPHLEALADELKTECTLSAVVDAHLVLVASAGAASTNGPPTVGRRMPMLPPLGGQFTAWGTELEMDSWLARSPHRVTPELREEYVSALARIRQLGWLAYRDDKGFAEVDRFAQQSVLVPEAVELAEFEHIVAELDPGFDILDLDSVTAAPVSRLITPVFGPDGKVALGLNIHLDAEPRPADQLAELRDRALAVARDISRVLAGTARENPDLRRPG